MGAVVEAANSQIPISARWQPHLSVSGPGVPAELLPRWSSVLPLSRSSSRVSWLLDVRSSIWEGRIYGCYINVNNCRVRNKKILILIVTYLLASLGFGTGFVLTSSSFVSPSSCFLIFLRTGTASALTSADSVFSAALCDILFSSSLWMAFGGGSGEGSFLFGAGFA